MRFLLLFLAALPAFSQAVSYTQYRQTFSPGAVWVRQGTVLNATVAWESGNIAEPHVLSRVTNCKVVSSPCLGMWFSGGTFTGAPGIGYAETADLTGATGWAKYASNPVLTNHYRPEVVHDGSTFYLFTESISTNQIDVYTSADTDGLVWALGTANIIAKGSAGQFDHDAAENSTVINDGGTWKMIYEGRLGPTTAPVYTCGVATASSPTGTWTKDAGNPLIGVPGCSGPDLRKVGSTFWMWGGAGIEVPSQAIARWNAGSSISGPYVLNPARGTFYDGAVFTAGSPDETPLPYGGIADGYRLELNGSTQLYYAATNDESASSGNSHIKLAIAAMTISTLVTTIEGMTTNVP